MAVLAQSVLSVSTILALRCSLSSSEDPASPFLSRGSGCSSCSRERFIRLVK